MWFKDSNRLKDCFFMKNMYPLVVIADSTQDEDRPKQGHKTLGVEKLKTAQTDAFTWFVQMP